MMGGGGRGDLLKDRLESRPPGAGPRGHAPADGGFQLFTRTGPLPCGRSFSLMMPSRLATSV